MSFISIRKLRCGFPIGNGDEQGSHCGYDFIVSPCDSKWRVSIFDKESLIFTERVEKINEARTFAFKYIEARRNGRM